MSTSGLDDPLFTVRQPAVLHSRDLTALLAGKVAAVRVPSMLDADGCAALMRCLDFALFDTYDPARVFPRVAKFGPGVNDYRTGGVLRPDYWDSAAEAWKDWQAMNLPLDPIHWCLGGIAKIWPGEVRVADRDGRKMFAGVVREINLGLQVHFDDVIREYDDPPFGEDVVAQLAFNLYLNVPRHGGETVIWRRRWQPRDERSRIVAGYGYEPEIVQDVQCVVLKPEAGEAVFFDPRNYHTVNPVSDSRRVSLGFFLAMTADGRLLAWS